MCYRRYIFYINIMNSFKGEEVLALGYFGEKYCFCIDVEYESASVNLHIRHELWWFDSSHLQLHQSCLRLSSDHDETSKTTMHVFSYLINPSKVWDLAVDQWCLMVCGHSWLLTFGWMWRKFIFVRILKLNMIFVLICVDISLVFNWILQLHCEEWHVFKHRPHSAPILPSLSLTNILSEALANRPRLSSKSASKVHFITILNAISVIQLQNLHISDRTEFTEHEHHPENDSKHQRLIHSGI